MAITIGSSNIFSLKAQRSLGDATSKVSKVYQQLSSGLRINDAGDDAAGLSISTKLNSDSRVFTVAIRNINDGVSAANIAEGALNSLKGISQRQLELAEQAANGVYSLKQRQAVDSESKALTDEFNRIVSSTEFNGVKLLDPSIGKISIQAGYGDANTLTLSLSDQLKRGVGDGSFSSNVSLGTGINFGAAGSAIADLNNDGKGDLLIENSGTIGILISDGDGTFASVVTYSTGISTASILTGDLNADGFIDIVAGDSTGNFSVLLGKGDGTFKAAVTKSSAVFNVTAGALGDFNGDGKLDIISSNTSGSGNSILFGNGDGTFRSQAQFGAGRSFSNITSGDFNGDGKLDVAAVDTGGFVSVFYGDGQGGFAASMTVATAAASFIAGDFNNDGTSDLFLGNGLYLGSSSGTFQTPLAFTLNFAAGVDINNDGYLDLIGTSGVAFGNGNGTFKPLQSVTLAGGSTYLFGDITGDGRKDYIGMNGGSTNVSFGLGQGGSTSTAQYFSLNTQADARSAMQAITANSTRISNQLGAIGAIGRRFEVATANLESQRLNYDAASSRITDIDVAQASAELIRSQINQQAAASILAQANQQPQLVLQLLRGAS